jgi:uncharacterized protein YidB (DUF937 family)
MAFLAYRAYQKHQTATSAGGASPGTIPAGNSMGQGQNGGGLGDILGGLFGQNAGASGSGGGIGDLLRGGLGSLLGGAAGGSVLTGGLGDLMGRLQKSGFADQANSWVGHGPNHEIAPEELESALGRDTLQSFAQKTGKPYQQVLSELSQGLPGTVDQLTPQGRLPNESEAQKIL